MPFGPWRHPMGSLESLLKDLSEVSPAIKYTIGTLAFAGAVGINIGAFVVGGPTGYLTLAGSIAGGIQGGVEASLAPDAGFDDIYMTAGLGSLFGAVCPLGGLGSLAGAEAFRGIAIASGQDKETIATAYQWGGLVGALGGGIGHSASQGARAAASKGARISSARALQMGIVRAVPELAGGGVGAIYGYTKDGTATSALHWATVGMFAGGISGGLARGLPSVRRAVDTLKPRRPLVRSRLYHGQGGLTRNVSDAELRQWIGGELYFGGKHGRAVLEGIESGKIRVNVLSDDLFNRYLIETNKTQGLAIGNIIYLRRSRQNILLDIVHEGRHALDYHHGGIRYHWRFLSEYRAYTAELHFARAMNMTPEYASRTSVIKHVLLNYGPF